MNKKGMEITFNWIFVAAAGSILLLFFIYFSWKQIDLFNEIGINEVVENINNQVDSLSIGLSSNKVVKLPNDVVFEFKCGNVFYKNAKKDTHNLIYARGNFSGEFNLWTKAWVFPFKIDNIYYASNIEKRFFILGNDNFFFNIPDKFRKFNSLNQDVNKDDVIIDFTNSNYFNIYKENKVLVADKETNLVTFYPGKKQEEFYDESLLFGALFTDYEGYKCLKNKALQRLALMSDLYKIKASLLKTNSKCSFQYNELEKTLDFFKINPLMYKNVLSEQNEQIKRDGCANVF